MTIITKRIGNQTVSQKMDQKKIKKSKNTNISDFFHPSSSASASGQSSAPKNQEKETEFFSSKEASETKSE